MKYLPLGVAIGSVANMHGRVPGLSCLETAHSGVGGLAVCGRPYRDLAQLDVVLCASSRECNCTYLVLEVPGYGVMDSTQPRVAGPQ